MVERKRESLRIAYMTAFHRLEILDGHGRRGVGPKRKKALLRKFGSVKGIREASIEEIATTVGFTTTLATKVKDSL